MTFGLTISRSSGRHCRMSQLVLACELDWVKKLLLNQSVELGTL